MKQIRVKEGKEHNCVRTGSVFNYDLFAAYHRNKKMVERIKQKFGKIIHKQFRAI